MTTSQVRHFPIAPARDARGALQYGHDDIALVRLAVRLTRLYRREGWPLWKVRAALLYLGPLMRVRFAEAADYALVVDRRDASALVMPIAARPVGDAGVVIPLDSLLCIREDRSVNESAGVEIEDAYAR